MKKECELLSVRKKRAKNGQEDHLESSHNDFREPFFSSSTHAMTMDKNG
jgi:hypothetical protein